MLTTATEFRQRFPHTVIRASAGTGKTFQLSNRYLALLHADVPVEQILATTFTRKAAGEILDRILYRLAHAASDPQAREELARHISAGDLPENRCRDLLLSATRSLHRMRIGTIDAFFSKLAGSFALELGLPPGWRIVEELQDIALREEAIESVLKQESTSGLFTLTNLLTKGETPRGVGELIRETVEQMYHLYLEAQPDAWTRLPRPKRLSSSELSETLQRLESMEFEGGVRMHTARDEDYSAAAAADWKPFTEKGIGGKLLEGSDTYFRQPIPRELAEVYQTLLREAKAKFLGDVANQTEAARNLLEKFHHEFLRLKQERRALRFDDITQRLSEFAQSDDPRRLAFRMDGAITHLLLDEFQDTSLKQWEVIRPLAIRATTGVARSSFFCVGDGKQAIYAWRGGVAELFDSLDGELSGLAEETLSHSRRSAPPIIDTVNRVFTSLTDHPNLDKIHVPIAQWQKSFPLHTTECGDLPGYVQMETCRELEKDEKAEHVALEYAAERVKQLVEQSPGRSVGVLVRRNEAVGRMIYSLRRLGVPASEEGGNPLVDSAPVELILSLLKLADHPGDTIVRYHIASSPVGQAMGMTEYRNDAAATEVARAARRSLLEEGYGQTIQRWAEMLKPHCDARDNRRLAQLVELAYQYQPSGTLRCDDFVALVEHTKVADPASADVRVMNIHQCKGLEFDIVVLPELSGRLRSQTPPFVVGRPAPTRPVDRICHYANEKVQALMPKEFQRLFAEEVERDIVESLCVLYVALTRAVHAMHIIIPPSTSKENSFPKTFSGLLRAALTDRSPAKPLTTLYECGDPNWHRSVAESQTKVEAPRDSKPTIALAPSPKGRSRGLETSSPSSLEGGSMVAMSHVFSKNDEALRRGELIHAFFEQVKWLDDGLPSDAHLAKLAQRIGLGSFDVKKLIAEFHSMIEEPEIAAALSRSAYQTQGRLEAYNERPFAVLDDGQVLQGYIDRLVLVHGESGVTSAEVLDFKTDAVDPDDEKAIEEKADFYRPQIAAYCRAVAQMTGLSPDQVSSQLLFVSAGVAKRLTKPGMKQQLLQFA